jgi:hypothetical protein
MTTSPELENLVTIGQLKREAPAGGELEGLRKSGEDRLKDSKNTTLSLASRFDLAYNAAHALALVALRRAGYRSENRHTVFSALAHTLGTPPPTVRVLLKCHLLRNQAEYEGHFDLDDRLVGDLILAAEAVRKAL